MHARDSETAAALLADFDKAALAEKIKRWGRELGFSSVGIARAGISEVSEASARLVRWLELERHGEMDYMARHRELRAAPAALLPGTASVISVRLPYWPDTRGSSSPFPRKEPGGMPAKNGSAADGEWAYVSRYALGRDYHREVRRRLQRLAGRIRAELAEGRPDPPFVCRVFSDSAPVMETEFAVRAGTSWRGKHTLTLSREGSWHFLGEIYTSLDLPADAPDKEHCGTCARCIDACPTAALVAPYEIDARRCVSYLTIELRGAIPLALRPSIGNRI
jgi:epoxyqueuosine reductase